MLIRRERTGDAAAVDRVHALAFRSEEAKSEEAKPPVEVALVRALRRSPAWLPALSLVGLDDDLVVGHVVCSRAHVGPAGHDALGLGPIGIDPAYQGRRFGHALMHAVLAAAEALDESIVGVLGDQRFYARFGFEPARRHGIEAPDPSWGDHFQVRLLSALTAAPRGTFSYAPPFAGL